jgi:hypothetical protein
MAKKINWERNASTGSYVARLDRNTRLIRDGDAPSALYRCEFWGDYSLKYPIKGDWSRSASAAIKSCSRLRKRSR